MATAPVILAQTQAAPPGKQYSLGQRMAVKEWAILCGGLVLGTMFFAAIVLVLLNRQRRSALRSIARERARSKPPTDAWAEAGKRIDPDSAARDDTADIDPDDIGPADIDEGPKR